MKESLEKEGACTTLIVHYGELGVRFALHDVQADDLINSDCPIRCVLQKDMAVITTGNRLVRIHERETELYSVFISFHAIPLLANRGEAGNLYTDCTLSELYYELKSMEFHRTDFEMSVKMVI